MRTMHHPLHVYLISSFFPPLFLRYLSHSLSNRRHSWTAMLPDDSHIQPDQWFRDWVCKVRSHRAVCDYPIIPIHYTTNPPTHLSLAILSILSPALLRESFPCYWSMIPRVVRTTEKIIAKVGCLHVPLLLVISWFRHPQKSIDLLDSWSNRCNLGLILLLNTSVINNERVLQGYTC